MDDDIGKKLEELWFEYRPRNEVVQQVYSSAVRLPQTPQSRAQHRSGVATFITGAIVGSVITAAAFLSYNSSTAQHSGGPDEIVKDSPSPIVDETPTAEAAAVPSNNLTLGTLRHVGEFYLGIDDGNPETKPFGETLTGKTLKKVFPF